MKRLLAILAIVGLVVLTASPAKAAPACQDAPLDLLGISVPLQVCVSVDGNEAVTTIVNGAGQIVDTITTPVQTIVERVEVPVVVPGPAPAPVTVTAPAPAPATRTVTQAPRTVTQEAPSPATETATETATSTATATATASPTNGPVGQDRGASGRVANESTPTLAVPPSNDEPGPIFDFVPDDPEVAAATFSIVGLLVGIGLGIIGLFVAYKRGRTDGEQATMDEFLGTITGPKHRA